MCQMHYNLLYAYFSDLKLTSKESDLDTQRPYETLLDKKLRVSLQMSAQHCWFLLQRFRRHDHTSSGKDPLSFSLSQSLKIHLQNNREKKNTVSESNSSAT